MADAARDAARRQGLRPESYQHFVFVVPADVPCNWIGFADIGGQRVWVKATTVRAFQHELGHNLAMDHGLRSGLSGDASDFMGTGAASLNAPHVAQMGWLDRTPDKVVEYSGPAEIRLEALEADPLRSSLPKIAILHTGAEGRDVYLSFRAASTANPLPDDVLKGVNIHIFAKGRKKGGNTLFAASLADGEVYRDGSLSVTQISHVPGESVTVRVGFSAMAPASSAGALQLAASNKCLDLAGGSKADGAAVIQV